MMSATVAHASAPRPMSLRVLSGIHAGAVSTVADGMVELGSQAPCAILLLDDGVAPLHLVVERDGADLLVTAKAPDVTIEGHVVGPDEKVAVALPVEIAIAGVRLGWALADTGLVQARQSTRTVAGWRGALHRMLPRSAPRAACLAVMIAGGGTILMSSATHALGPARASRPASGLPAMLPHSTDEAPTDVQLRQQLTTQLRAMGLAGLQLTVSADVAELAGTVDPSQAGTLHALELWFDHSYGDRAVLLAHVTTQPLAMPAIVLDAVWSGTDANVVVGGTRYPLGAILPDGSRLEQITDRQLLVSRDGTRYAIDY